MKIKKVLSTAALATLLTAGLASCGGGESSTVSKNIVFYNTCGQSLQTVIDTAITSFTEKYPEWTVTSTQVGGYEDVYSTNISDLTAGTQPDLSYCYADHVASFLESGKVLDMSSFINSTETVTTAAGKQETVGYSAAEIADFVPGYYEEGKAKNFANYQLYGFSADSMLTMPMSKSTELMYYNKTALNKLGIDVPTTWDEMWAACEMIKKTYKDSAPLVYDSESNWFINMCEQNGWAYTTADGNAHYQFNNENVRNWLTDLKTKKDLGYFNTATTANVDYTSSLFTTGAEECIFCIGSSAGASYQNPNGAFEWGIAPVPGSTGTNGKVISQGPSLVMFDQGKSDAANEKEKMSWLFAKELLKPALQAAFSMTSGYNPVRQSAFEIESYAEFLADDSDIKAAAAKTASELTNNFYTSAVFNGSATARTQVGSALVYVVQGEKDAEKALSDAVKNCGGNK